MFKAGNDDRKVLGDATDSGLLRYCDKLAPSGVLRMAYKKVCEGTSFYAGMLILYSAVLPTRCDANFTHE